MCRVECEVMSDKDSGMGQCQGADWCRGLERCRHSRWIAGLG